MNPVIDKPTVDWRKPCCCGGDSIAGEKAAGCCHNEVTNKFDCFCLKKPTFNWPLVYTLLQAMYSCQVFKSSDIAVKWTAFCNDMARDGQPFSRYKLMNAKVLRKQFGVIMEDAKKRIAQGSSAGYESHKEVTPADDLIERMLAAIEREAALARLKKKQKEEITSSKLHIETQVLGEDEDEDNTDPIYKVPKRKISMLQSQGDGDDSGEEMEIEDEDNVGALAYTTKDADGYTSITMGNKPQNGTFNYVSFQSTYLCFLLRFNMYKF